jgi:uncharacterized protein (TIGR00730 family)
MKRICVFCGSVMGISPIYKEAAENMGKALVKRGLGLVYGGGNIGLMGAIADAVLAVGGEAVGVIPEFLESKEIAHTHLTELYIVSSMHERKALMADLADGFIAMPGGYGTLEEFCEILTWAQLSLHKKPIGLLNIDGFYDQLLSFFDNVMEQKFIKPAYRSMVLEAKEPELLLDLMINYQAPNIDKLTPKKINR